MLGLAVAGCDRGGAPDTSLEIPRWTLELELTYPHNDSAPLSTVQDLAVLPGGRILVSDRDTAPLLRFGPDGAYEGMIGRPGDGVGEITHVIGFGVVGDTIWVADGALGRLTLFSADGGVIESTQVLEEALPGAIPYGRLSDGAALLAIARRDSTGRGGATGGAFFRATPGNPSLLFELETLDRWFVVLPPGTVGTSSRHQPFSHYPQFAVSKTGDRIARIDRPAPDSVGAGAFRVRLMAPDGSTTVDTEIPYAPRALTDEMFDRWIGSVLTEDFIELNIERGLFRTRGAVYDATVEAVTRPSYVPPTSNRGSAMRDPAVLLTADGALWLERWYEPQAPERPWDVLGADGRRIAWVGVPNTVRLLDVKGEYAWGVVRDEASNPTIVRLRIRTEPATP